MPSEFRSQVEALRPYLVRFAKLQLRNPEAAEDAVQDALVAALAAERDFGGRSSLRTWLTGILKHKIMDAIRRAGRERPPRPDDSAGGAEDFEALFDERGHWRSFPQDWGDPDRALEDKQFMAALEKCLAGLPPRTAQAFLMREHLGMETVEICKELGLTPTNCFVMLYRARMALRECLAAGWFAK